MLNTSNSAKTKPSYADVDYTAPTPRQSKHQQQCDRQHHHPKQHYYQQQPQQQQDTPSEAFGKSIRKAVINTVGESLRSLCGAQLDTVIEQLKATNRLPSNYEVPSMLSTESRGAWNTIWEACNSNKDLGATFSAADAARRNGAIGMPKRSDLREFAGRLVEDIVQHLVQQQGEGAVPPSACPEEFPKPDVTWYWSSPPSSMKSPQPA